MKKIYTAWAREGEKWPHCIYHGEDPPRTGNGEILEGCEVTVFSIEAHSHEEAMAIYHLRQGWEPYKPLGKASPCPECGALFYPEGSGQCWQCDFVY